MKRIVLILPLCLWLQGCELFNIGSDPKPQLPPITQEGKNTFGCLVNGEIWLPKARPGQPSVWADTGWDYTIIYSENNISKQGFSLVVIGAEVPINQHINFGSTMDSTFAAYSGKNGCQYESDALISGWIQISKYSKKEQILAGEFELSVYKADCGDTVKITQGRFDIGNVYY